GTARCGAGERHPPLYARAARLHARDRRAQAPAAGARPQAGVGALTAALSVEDLSVVYDHHHALKEVSLEVATGESFGLVGESGSGKSTLLRAIAGLAPLTAGAIAVNGE